MSVFKVEVSRVGYASLTLDIEADSRAEAEDKAMDEAGDHIFSEHSSEYSLVDGTQDPVRAAEEGAENQDLVDKVLEQLKADAAVGDYTALEELFLMLLRGVGGDPQTILTGYLKED